MKLLIFLKVEYRGKAEPALKQFRADVKSLPDIKIVEELPPHPQVIIKIPDEKQWEVYDELRKLDIVETIDSIIPKDKQ